MAKAKDKKGISLAEYSKYVNAANGVAASCTELEVKNKVFTQTLDMLLKGDLYLEEETPEPS